ncbi:N-acetylmannosamine-6-phosphate 2-epimerase [Oceanobacillus kapialis]|uniref:N-acetylmannosamine-6-phosphate 2-epimerase n=1 Tax=Oceanobacillus kapialis TaxID=481353 RepID=UPI00384E855D
MSKKLIVSCQALEDEPLHSPYIMSKMALAAYQGGASGLRANTVADIQAIKKEVDLPIIGIIKQDYADSEVKITPTIEEVEALYEEGVEIIGFDATDRLRPNSESFEKFFERVKERFPDQKFMADVSTVQEAIFAEKCGVDIVATTLVGYTAATKGDNPLKVLEAVLESTNIPVIAEGNMNTPEKAKRALELGAYAVVVGTAITRPQWLTETFSKKMCEVE